jgi:hypothetical protein
LFIAQEGNRENRMTATVPSHVATRALCIGLVALALAPLDSAAIEIMGHANGGAFKQYPVTGVPLLETFYFRYTSGDNHVESIAVEPASPIPNPSPESSNVPAGQIFVTLQDNSRDDQIFYKVEHTAVPDGVHRRKTFDFCRRTCRLPLDRPSRDHVFVIVGFSFFFPADDHHLRRVGLWEQDGEVHVHFADEDAGDSDDVFRFELEYVYLPPAMVAKTGHESGDGVRGGERRAIDVCPAPGPIVIRGFDFEFQPYTCYLFWTCQDQHIREIGVLTPGNNIEVYYADKNPDSAGDKFNWGVDWAALASAPPPPIGSVEPAESVVVAGAPALPQSSTSGISCGSPAAEGI